MLYKAFLLLVVFAAVSLYTAEAKHWALLVAGSNTYDNYRHQADICHAYHIMRNHGIPAENIVTMMYDDVAYNERNPFKGNIINRPNGPNVYPGVVIDYKGKDVNPTVFLAALRGDEETIRKETGRAGKVIKSGPEDHIFVNFADHGDVGLIAFPTDMLTAKTLHKELMGMHKKKLYKEMVIYVEACYSGSMFHNLLPDNINIYAETAANRSQSSYACYWDKTRQTYLGDVYSVNWMQDSDKKNLRNETIQQQYFAVRKLTNTSQVNEYGDMSISKMEVAEFQGNMTASGPAEPYVPITDAVPAPEVELSVLQHRLSDARTPEEEAMIAKEIGDLLNYRLEIDALYQDIVKSLKQTMNKGGMVELMEIGDQLSYSDLLAERPTITQWDCYENAVKTLLKSCPKMRLTQNYHALGQLNILANLCERGIHSRDVSNAVLRASSHSKGLCF